MGVLDRFERRIETLVEGAFAKAFRAHVQPVEIARAIERELDDKAMIVGQAKTLVPNCFTVELAADDAERLGSADEVLAAELVTSTREHAAQHGFSFAGPVEVSFTTADDLDTGIFRVRSETKRGPIDELASGPASTTSARLEDPQTQSTYALSAPVVVLGRGADVDIRIEDAGVSRTHAQIRRIGEAEQPGHELTDLGSTNGTFVNGHRIARHHLTDGDRIELGGVTLIYRTAAD